MPPEGPEPARPLLLELGSPAWGPSVEAVGSDSPSLCPVCLSTIGFSFLYEISHRVHGQTVWHRAEMGAWGTGASLPPLYPGMMLGMDTTLQSPQVLRIKPLAGPHSVTAAALGAG